MTPPWRGPRSRQTPPEGLARVREAADIRIEFLKTRKPVIIELERGFHARRKEDSFDAMPTLLVVEGFRFFFFSWEGTEPPHVHVEKGDGYAKLWLSPVLLVYARGLTRAEIRRIRELTHEHAKDFLKRWNEHIRR